MRKDHNFRSQLEDTLDRIQPNLWQDFVWIHFLLNIIHFLKKEIENEPCSFSDCLTTNNKNFKSQLISITIAIIIANNQLRCFKICHAYINSFNLYIHTMRLVLLMCMTQVSRGAWKLNPGSMITQFLNYLVPSQGNQRTILKYLWFFPG